MITFEEHLAQRERQIKKEQDETVVLLHIFDGQIQELDLAEPFFEKEKGDLGFALRISKLREATKNKAVEVEHMRYVQLGALQINQMLKEEYKSFKMAMKEMSANFTKLNQQIDKLERKANEYDQHHQKSTVHPLQ